MNFLSLDAAKWSWEASGVAAVLLDGRGLVRWTSTHAEHILQYSDHLRMHLGRLHLQAPVDDERLQSTVAHACHDWQASFSGGREMKAGGGDEWWRLLFLKLPPETFTISTPPPTWIVILLVADTPQPSSPLTKAERAILDLVRAGLETDAIAQRRNVKANSIRMQLKSIYLKYKVNSRAALIAKLSR